MKIHIFQTKKMMESRFPFEIEKEDFVTHGVLLLANDEITRIKNYEYPPEKERV